MKLRLLLILTLGLLSMESMAKTGWKRSDLLQQIYHHPDTAAIMVLAHRGDHLHAPENSLLSLRNCIRMGVDMIEIDVRRTKDGHFVLMHNATIDHMTNGSGAIDSLTLKELRRYRLKGPDGKLTHERIPTLQEVFRVAKGKILINIDKGYSYYPEICDLAARMGVLQQINFKFPDHVPEAHALRDGLTTRVECMPVIVMSRNDAAESIAYYLERGVGAIECVMNQITPRIAELLCQIKARGIRILVGTMWLQVSGGYTDEKALCEGADASWGVLLRHGTTVFQTDYPQEMLDYLNRHGYRSKIDKNPDSRLAISK